MLKNIFLEVKKKFETAMSVLRKENITLDPEDPAAIKQYANVMKTARKESFHSRLGHYVSFNAKNTGNKVDGEIGTIFPSTLHVLHLSPSLFLRITTAANSASLLIFVFTYKIKSNCKMY